MGGGEAVIVAGIGCRRGCPAEDIVALVRQAGGADALAAPAWKHDEAGIAEAARLLDLNLRFIDDAALAAMQDQCPTRSAAVARATGHASVAEAAALAGGGRLVLARIAGGLATCALAEHP
jgi:cobalt-precorrin 5A hydrolase